MRGASATLALLLGLCAVAACGKKGPPLPPLRYVPGPPTELQARRTANEVRLQFKLPTANVQGQGPIALDRLEVFAVTVAAESSNPPNRDLLDPKYLIGTVPVKPQAQEGEPQPAPDAPPDTRPAPGETTTFVEELNEAKLKPQITTPAAPEVAPTQPSAAAAAAAAAQKTIPVTRRIYVVRGLTRSGRPGQPSARIVLPVVDLPSPPTGLDVTYDAKAITISWIAPVPSLDQVAPTFNVYQEGSPAPLNPKPLSTTTFVREGLTFGTEECFTVRTAVAAANVTLESLPTTPVCVTPTDTFPPAAPTGLSAVATEGAINLIWERNTDADLAGYLVLRGEAPGDTLQAITATPIQETTYRDTTVTPGVRYVYAIVAVDRATPPNTSAQSARVEETAR